MCAAAHRIRSRPAMYPPTPQAKSCTAMNHAPASTPNVVTEGLWLDHGETETRPIPAPSVTKMRVNAEATKAPAITAAQDTAEELSSASRLDRGAWATMTSSIMV